MLNKGSRFWGSAIIHTITPDNLGVLVEMFPQLNMVAPIVKSSGVIDKSGNIDIDKLEEILEAGFDSSEDVLPIEFGILDKKYEINITPKTWDAFKKSF